MNPLRNIANWLPDMIGPLEIQAAGVRYAVQRIVWNFAGAGLAITDDPDYVDPDDPDGEPIGRTVFTFSGLGGGATAPANTGFAHVTGSAFDANATPNIRYVAGKFQTDGNLQWRNAADANRTGDLVWTPSGSNKTITLPNANGTVVLRDTTESLTNKTINLAANTLTATDAEAGDTLVHNGTKFVAVPQTSVGGIVKIAGDADVSANGILDLLVGGVVASTVIFTGSVTGTIRGFSPAPASGSASEFSLIAQRSAESNLYLSLDDVETGDEAKKIVGPSGFSFYQLDLTGTVFNCVTYNQAYGGGAWILAAIADLTSS